LGGRFPGRREGVIEFQKAKVETVRRRMQYIEEHEKELQPRTITVNVTKGDDFISSASSPGSDLVWYSDEPRERGGDGKAPTPLFHFLSGMGFCQFVHYAEHLMVDGVTLESLQMKVDGKVSLQRPRRFIEVSYEVSVTSQLDDETVRALARRAADDCYATNTLKRACTVTGIVLHNGRKIDEHR
jgi:uncharacterized OsmC-like protein